jgi:hypothetical protein
MSSSWRDDPEAAHDHPDPVCSQRPICRRGQPTFVEQFKIVPATSAWPADYPRASDLQGQYAALMALIDDVPHRESTSCRARRHGGCAGRTFLEDTHAQRKSARARAEGKAFHPCPRGVLPRNQRRGIMMTGLTGETMGSRGIRRSCAPVGRLDALEELRRPASRQALTVTAASIGSFHVMLVVRIFATMMNCVGGAITVQYTSVRAPIDTNVIPDICGPRAVSRMLQTLGGGWRSRSIEAVLRLPAMSYIARRFAALEAHNVVSALLVPAGALGGLIYGRRSRFPTTNRQQCPAPRRGWMRFRDPRITFPSPPFFRRGVPVI